MNDFLTRQLKAISRVEQLSSPLLSSSPLPLGPSVRPSSVGAGGRARVEEKKTLALEMALFEGGPQICLGNWA